MFAQKRYSVTLVLLIIALLVVACGDGDEGGEDNLSPLPMAPTVAPPIEPATDLNTSISSQSPTATPVEPDESEPDEPPFFDGEVAFDYAEMQVDFGFRPTGSEALEMTRQAMIEVLEEAGWDVELQTFEHNANGEVFEAVNVIAKRGTGPITLIGSHYDSRLWADKDADQSRLLEGVIGANDGASSTGAVLALAEVIDQHYTLNGQIWLVLFDAEDNGRIPGWDEWIIGSRYMADNLDELGITADDIRFMLLLDMIGEADGQYFRQEGYSVQYAPEYVDAIWDIAADLGYSDYFPDEERGRIIDDHLPFIELGIPAVDIIDLDYPYHHTTEDTLDKISAESLDRVGDVVEMYLIQTNIIEQVSE